MSYPYRLISPEELASPREMEPAVVLRLPLEKFANVIAEHVGMVKRDLVFHDLNSDVMYLRVDNVPLAFVSFNEEPREMHVYVADRNVKGESNLLALLARLPLAGVEGDWWTREDQPTWPGNGSETFVIRERGHHA